MFMDRMTIFLTIADFWKNNQQHNWPYLCIEECTIPHFDCLENLFWAYRVQCAGVMVFSRILQKGPSIIYVSMFLANFDPPPPPM